MTKEKTKHIYFLNTNFNYYTNYENKYVNFLTFTQQFSTIIETKYDGSMISTIDLQSSMEPSLD